MSTLDTSQFMSGAKKLKVVCPLCTEAESKQEFRLKVAMRKEHGFVFVGVYFLRYQ